MIPFRVQTLFALLPLSCCLVSGLAFAQPPIPFIEHGSCPFEGCQFGQWITQTPLRAYAQEGDTSHVSFTLQPADTFTALTGNLHIERPGLVLVRRDQGQYRRGDTVYVLSYSGEGFHNIWHRGEERNVEAFWHSEGDSTETFAEIVRQPVMFWWVNVLSRQGQKGWLCLLNTSPGGFGINERIRGMDYLE